MDNHHCQQQSQCALKHTFYVGAIQAMSLTISIFVSVHFEWHSVTSLQLLWSDFFLSRSQTDGYTRQHLKKYESTKKISWTFFLSQPEMTEIRKDKKTKMQEDRQIKDLT